MVCQEAARKEVYHLKRIACACPSPGQWKQGTVNIFITPKLAWRGDGRCRRRRTSANGTDRSREMVALPRGVAKKVVVQRAEHCCSTISCPDVFEKHGIELRSMCCCQEGWDPRSVAARKQFLDIHRVQKPDLIVCKKSWVLHGISWESNATRLEQCC